MCDITLYLDSYEPAFGGYRKQPSVAFKIFPGHWMLPSNEPEFMPSLMMLPPVLNGPSLPIAGFGPTPVGPLWVRL